MNIKINKAFTLVELGLVVIIVTVLATIALPRFTTALERGYEADAVNQLRSIHAAQRIYRSRAKTYWPNPAAGTQNVAAINTNLGLSVIENGFAITCTEGNTTFFCQAVRTTGGAYTVGVDENSLGANNPCCEAGTCPTITVACT